MFGKKKYDENVMEEEDEGEDDDDNEEDDDGDRKMGDGDNNNNNNNNGEELTDYQFQRKRIERRIIGKNVKYANKVLNNSPIIRVVRLDGKDVRLQDRITNPNRLNVFTVNNKIIKCVGWG